MNYAIIDELLVKFCQDLKDLQVNCPEVSVYTFPQTWASSALGYDRCGGQAFTTAQTVVLMESQERIVRVYFGCKELAYELVNPNTEFTKDLTSFNLKPVSDSYKYTQDYQKQCQVRGKDNLKNIIQMVKASEDPL